LYDIYAQVEIADFPVFYEALFNLDFMARWPWNEIAQAN